MDYEENNRYVHDYEDSGRPIPSTKIGYDNTDSGLDATNVQGAIDEVAQILDTKQDKAYDGTESGIEADTVTGAIDELAQDISDLTDVVEGLDTEKQGTAFDNTTSGLTADTIVGAINELATTRLRRVIYADNVDIEETIDTYLEENGFTIPTLFIFTGVTTGDLVTATNETRPYIIHLPRGLRSTGEGIGIQIAFEPIKGRLIATRSIPWWGTPEWSEWSVYYNASVSSHDVTADEVLIADASSIRGQLFFNRYSLHIRFMIKLPQTITTGWNRILSLNFVPFDISNNVQVIWRITDNELFNVGGVTSEFRTGNTGRDTNIVFLQAYLNASDASKYLSLETAIPLKE